jgi:flagellar FliJ protein
MKSRDTLVRLKKFQADEKARRVAQIEAMIAEFTRMTTDLDREIGVEEQRSGNADPSHFAYSTYARAARTRRDNLANSIAELRDQAEEAKALHADALEELKKAESLDGREKALERLPEIVRPEIDFGALRPARA